jgi:hypothetical protein
VRGEGLRRSGGYRGEVVYGKIHRKKYRKKIGNKPTNNENLANNFFPLTQTKPLQHFVKNLKKKKEKCETSANTL